MRRASLILLGLALAAVAWQVRGPAPPLVSDRDLSILLITVDTLRADALGSYGNGRAATPWMDRLAAGGLRFEHAHAHAVLTLPSHASLLSGVYPPDHGVRDNAGFRFPAGLPTIATVLKAAGYSTGAFVSAFPLDARFGLTRGFDAYDAAFVDSSPRPPMLEQERPGTETVTRARRWLDAHAAERTFCWVHLFEPHAPYAAPEPFGSRFRDAPYAGEVAAADAALEPLLRPVVEAAARGRTLVVLTGDHGEALGDHGEATHGVFAYEATLRVPLIVYAPALAAPRVVATDARHVDVLPTILDAIGVPAPAGLRGRSLLRADAIAGEPRGAGYFESLGPALNRGWAPLRGIARAGMKYIELPVPELYDLTADPAETRNLLETRAADVRDLRQRLSEIASGSPDATRIAETADARARLESLGYVSGTAATPGRYTEAHDPKRLISLDGRLQEAVRLYTSGDRAQARAVAEALVRERPDMRVAWMTLAQIQRDTGSLEGAVASLRRAHALAPGDAGTTALLGAYLIEAGKASEAVALLESSTPGEPGNLELAVTLALAQARAGRGDAAVGTLERARAAYPANAMLLVHLGTVQLIANRRADARRSFDASLALNPDLARAHSSLAAMNAEDGRPAEAIAEWREATRLDPAEYGRIFLLGVSLARAGRTEPARTCLSFFVDAAPPAHWTEQLAAARRWLTRAP